MWIKKYVSIFLLVIIFSPLSPNSKGVLANTTCLTHQILCDGFCATLCDGFVECNNKEDELEERCKDIRCSSPEDRTEGLSAGNLGDILSGLDASAGAKYKCAYGGCIARNFVCNGHKDCWDGSDETSLLCATEKCSRRQFQCAYGACIRKLWKCNGKPHCVDNSDETEELCQNNRCSSAKFQCDYGGCIEKRFKCNGIVDCIDSSDESEQTCGPNHILNTTPTTTTTTTTPTTTTTTTTETPGTPLIHVGPPSNEGGCTRDGLCACPSPYTHFCVPCDNIQACGRIDEVGVCNMETERETTLRRVKVNVLACGTQPVLNIAGLIRQHEDDTCGSAGKVPVLSVVSAECWGITTLMQCQADGMWHYYGTLHTHTNGTQHTPTPRLCQPQHINSPVCGQRPRYLRKPGSHFTFSRQPEWPWLVGIKRDGKYSCASAIITPHFLLTAAHCLTRSKTSTEAEDPRNLRIQRINERGIVVTEFVLAIYIYPGYESGNSPSNDVALLRVEKEIVFSGEVFPVCVYSQNVPLDKIAATFSRTSENYQWELILQRYDSRCFAPSDRCSTSLHITSDKFCAIDTESLRFLPEGSSGGPYLINTGSDAQERWAVGGVVSSSRSETHCANRFTLFTSIHSYMPWISECVHRGNCS